MRYNGARETRSMQCIVCVMVNAVLAIAYRSGDCVIIATRLEWVGASC